MADMFDEVTSANIAAYWKTLAQQEQPYLGDVLFPNTTVPNRNLDWYRGLSRAPKPLALSALDAQAIPRDRQGFDHVSTQTAFFKESKYIDEDLRQELLRVASSPIQAQRDIILGKIYNDSVELIKGAALVREIMRMQLLQTGKIAVAGNGQAITEDYQMKASHIADAAGKWGETGSSPLDDIRKAQDAIGNEEGITLTRAVMNAKTFRALLSDPEVKATLLANNGNTAAAAIPKAALLAFLQDEFSLAVQVYDKGYTDVTGAFQHFVSDGNVVLMPEVALGTTAFSPTPEQADLLANTGADVSIVDTGVAITTTSHADPVTKETKVSQYVKPTFEQIDGVYVIHSFSQAAGTTTVPGGVTGSESTSTTTQDKGSESESTAAPESTSTSTPDEA